MATVEENLERLDIIVTALGDLADDSIFIGGACTQFYVPNPHLRNFRPTKDIDCLIKVYTYKEFAAYEKSLRSLGFINDITAEAPLIRYKYKDIPVDFIPDNGAVVGLRPVRWFSEGRESAQKRTLSSGREIKVLSLAYYLAAKFESWQDRGKQDFLGSPDLEDIVGILDGIDSLDEVYSAPNGVREYLVQSFGFLYRNDLFKNSLSGLVGYDDTASKRASNIINKISRLLE